LITKVDVLVIGGAMANTFLAAQGYQVGRSLAELDLRETAKQIISDKVMLPTDVVVAETLQPNAHHRITGINDVTPHEMILDVGPRTIRAFSRRLQTMKTLVWNGRSELSKSRLSTAVRLPPPRRSRSSHAKVSCFRLQEAAIRWQHWRMRA